MPLRPILVLFLCGPLAGCFTPTKRISLSEAAKLPVSTGTYTGKIWATPWLYRGSDTHFHHFLYTYTRDNQVRHIEVSMSKTELTLAFERSLAAMQGRLLEVNPVPGPFGGIETFSPASASALPRWDTAPPPLPAFDEKMKVDAPGLSG